MALKKQQKLSDNSRKPLLDFDNDGNECALSKTYANVSDTAPKVASDGGYNYNVTITQPIFSKSTPQLLPTSSNSICFGRPCFLCYSLSHASILIILFLLTVIIYYQFNLNVVFKSFSISAFSSPTALLSLCNPYFNQDLYQSNNHHLTLNESLQIILRDIQDAPEIVFSTKLIKENRDSSKCSHYSCFDIYKCGMINYNPYELPKLLKHDLQERIKVYVYPSYKFVPQNSSNGEYLQVPKSLEYSRILRAIVSSPYYTSNILEACLFVPNLDLLNYRNLNIDNIEKALWSFPQFSSANGSNHLFFSMFLSDYSTKYRSQFPIDVGNSLIAGGGFDISTYRSNFDISIPVYSVFSQLYETANFDPIPIDVRAIFQLVRRWTLVSTQVDSLPFEIQYYLTRLESIYSNKMLLLGHNCSNVKSIYNEKQFPFLSNLASPRGVELYNNTHACNLDRKIRTRYIDILHDSEFCLILKTYYLGTPLLSDALMSGCIPVVVIDSYVLPFAERIDWTTVVIRVWEHAINDLFDIINSISEQRRQQFRIAGLHVWQKYFRNVENVALTTLSIVNERVFSKPKNVFALLKQDFYELTPLSAEYFSKGYSYISPKNVYLVSQGFTGVILTYNRVESLYQVILSVSRVPSCSKILVIWNNQDLKPPISTQWPSVSVPIQVIITDQNKLSNRFYPYSSIETDAIFAIDDDITMLTPDEIEFAYQTWREFPDRIVGFPSRLHYWDNHTQCWNYDSEWKNQISLVLTGAAFYHNYYNYLYTYTMPASVRDWVDTNMNCEDIAINFLVSNVTGKAPVKVTPRKKFKCPECSRSSSLSDDVVKHLKMRSKCIDYFASIYQPMPLKSVEFRSNPVLFKDNIPEKFKHYNMIGNL